MGEERRGFLRRAEEIALAARQVTLGAVRRGFTHQRKPDRSFVTEVDVEVEKTIRGLLRKHFPEHGVIGEELDERVADSVYSWVVDPIDGTHSLRHGIPLFGTLLALMEDQRPVVGVLDLPGLGTLYSAGIGLGAFLNGESLRTRGLDGAEPIEQEVIAIGERKQFLNGGTELVFDTLMGAHPSVRTYCDCFGHALAIEGAVGAMVDYGLRVWDLAATEVLVKEAGGKFIRLRVEPGSDGEPRHDVVFGKPHVVDWVLARIPQPA
jgi:fructose-1,6-bisphosphatase/inositol monophosphatase family enzyme